MSPKPPSDAQLEYLRDLGYRGVAPRTSREASEAIQAMLDTKDAAIAEAEVLHERADAPYRYRRGQMPHGRRTRGVLGSVVAALFWAVVIVVVLALLVVIGFASL